VSRIDAAVVSHCKYAYAFAALKFEDVWPWACNISGCNNKLLKRKYSGVAGGPDKSTSKRRSS
jgi:hypothetical protein